MTILPTFIRNRLAFCLGVLALCLATAAPSAHAQSVPDTAVSGTLTVGVKTDYAPFSSSRGGRFTGFEVDMARRLANDMGLALELVAVSSANRFDKLAQGDVDMLLATVGDTQSRRQAGDKVLVQPHYYASGTRLLLRRSHKVAAWPDIAGMRLCGLIGNYSNLDLRQLGARLMLYASTKALENALASNVCDGWAYDNTKLEHMATLERWKDFRVLLPMRNPTYWSAILDNSQKGQQLHSNVVNAFSNWHRDGTLINLASVWGLKSSFLSERNSRFATRPFGVACEPIGPTLTRSCRLPASISERPKAATAPVGTWLQSHGIDLPMMVDATAQDVFLSGMSLSVQLAVYIFVFAFLAGALKAYLMCVHPWIGMFVRPLVDLSRMTPPVLQLLMVFYIVVATSSSNAADWSFWIATLMLGLYGSSIAANSIHGAYISIRAETWPNHNARFLKAYEMSLKMTANATLTVVKASPMAAIILTPELVSASRDITLSDGGYPWETYIVLLLFTIVMVFGASVLFSFLETKARRALRWHLESRKAAPLAGELEATA